MRPCGGPRGRTWQVDPSGLLRDDLEVRGPTSAVTEHMVEGILGAAPTLNRNGSVYLIAGTSEVLAGWGRGRYPG